MQKKVSSPNYFPDQFVAIPISVQDHIFLWFCFTLRLFESCVINDHIEDERSRSFMHSYMKRKNMIICTCTYSFMSPQVFW